MNVYSLSDFTRGWIIGNFEPSLLKTDKFEVAIMHHKKGEEWSCHYHTATEYNYLAEGKMLMHGITLNKGDVFVIHPYEIADPIFLEDCVVVVVKTPSIPGDKYLADRPNKKSS